MSSPEFWSAEAALLRGTRPWSQQTGKTLGYLSNQRCMCASRGSFPPAPTSDSIAGEPCAKGRPPLWPTTKCQSRWSTGSTGGGRTATPGEGTQRQVSQLVKSTQRFEAPSTPRRSILRVTTLSGGVLRLACTFLLETATARKPDYCRGA